MAANSVVILGAGASAATHGLPGAKGALRRWERDIRSRRPLLLLALETWVGKRWPASDLEAAWLKIDLAWNERLQPTGEREARQLREAERREVWRVARELERSERTSPHYYRTQNNAWMNGGYSTEQFLSVVAGWELRCLIQETFTSPLREDAVASYRTLFSRTEARTVISFNFDTLLEQHVTREGTAWTYDPGDDRDNRVRVLKPHGSVSLTHVSPMRPDVPDQVLDVQLRVEDMGYHVGHWSGPWLVQNLIVGLRAKTEHTPHEQAGILRAHFQGIVNACTGAFQNADEVWAIGYSFPPTDTNFTDTVARGRSGRSCPVHVVTMKDDDTKKMVQRVRDLFGAKPDVDDSGFTEWASKKIG